MADLPGKADSEPTASAAGTPPGPPYKGWPEHRYVYSSEDGDSCTCGWRPGYFRMTPEEWDRHVEEAEK